MSRVTTLPVPDELNIRSELETVALISLSVMLMLESTVRLSMATTPVPEVVSVRSAFEGELIVLPMIERSPVPPTPLTCESTYVLIALADASVSSEPLTELMSVSNTPDFKFATSTLDRELPVPSASNVLLVNVNVSLAMLASCASTYAFVAASCADAGSVTLTILFEFMFACDNIEMLPVPFASSSKSSLDASVNILLPFTTIVPEPRFKFPLAANVISPAACTLIFPFELFDPSVCNVRSPVPTRILAA